MNPTPGVCRRIDRLLVERAQPETDWGPSAVGPA